MREAGRVDRGADEGQVGVDGLGEQVGGLIPAGLPLPGSGGISLSSLGLGGRKTPSPFNTGVHMNQKLIDTFTGLRNHIDLLQDDANKAATGNKAAGTRLPEGMQQAKVMCQRFGRR